MTAAFPLEGRVAVVTGATGGMGQVIARELASGGAHVVAVTRSSRVNAPVGPGSLEIVTGDLGTRAGIAAVSRAILDRHGAVHLLVNNAGAHFTEHRLSADGLEMHVAVDYLAAYGLTRQLGDALRRGRARVVNVASDTMRDARMITAVGRARPVTLGLDGINDLRDVNPRHGFKPMAAYARAKLMTVTAGNGFAVDGVTVNALHPGIVSTSIVHDLTPALLRPFRSLIHRGLLSPEEGAAPTLRLATDPALEGVTGRYFVRDVETHAPAEAYDTKTQDRLRELTDAFLNPPGSPAAHR